MVTYTDKETRAEDISGDLKYVLLPISRLVCTNNCTIDDKFDGLVKIGLRPKWRPKIVYRITI